MRVTNHAVLRYIERVIGIDPEAIRDEIRALAYPGSPELSKIVVEDGVVVTILGDGMRVGKNKESATKEARSRCASEPQ